MGAIGSRRASSVKLRSTDDAIFCHLCPNARSTAYCVDCQIYLCTSCKGQHKKYPAFKDHQLLKARKITSSYAKGPGTRTNALDKCSDFVSSTDPADRTITILRQMADLCLDKKVYFEDMAAVTPGTLLISNGIKKRVQLLDRRKGRFLCKVQLQDAPGRMCLTDRNTAAVCVGLDKIQMIQVEDKTMTLCGVVTVGKYIRGITSSRNTLVVSYRKKPWLEKVSMGGKVLKQFDNEGNSQHFQCPDFLCSTPDGSVFISDLDREMITQVDTSLNILQTFTSPLLKWPKGITAVREDLILVCSYSRENDSIMLLQPSTNTMSTLLGRDDEIYLPNSLAYCPDEKKLFVKSGTSNKVIKVYQIA